MVLFVLAARERMETRNNINTGINTSSREDSTHTRQKGQETVMPDRKSAVGEGGMSHRWRT